jgi:molybdopterin converting factor small subunit
VSQVTVQIPPPLRPFADDAAELRVEAHSVAEALAAIGAGRAALLARILTPEGELRPYVNVFVGERNIRRLDGLETRLGEADVVAIIPAVAGGGSLQRNIRLPRLPLGKSSP